MGRSARGEFAYQCVYRYLDALIAQADYAEQGRLPSLRVLAQRLRVSLATVQCAYSLLERQGRVRSVPKSGYFVNFAEREIASTGAHAPLAPPVSIPAMPSPRTLERTLLAHERRLSRQGGQATWRLGSGALLRSVLAARYTRASGHCWNARHVHLATDVQALLETLLLALRLQGATLGAEAPYAYLLCRQPGVDEAIARRGFLLPPLRQQAVAHTFTKGEVDDSLPALRFDLQTRMEYLCSRIELRLGAHLAFARPDGGWGIWARLNRPIDMDAILAAAAGSPLSVIPGELFGLKGSFPQHVLLAWCAESWDGLEHVLRRLGRVLVSR
ncbi:GntR family transcriptional regulator [Pseudomonas putida]|uniref:GntR family transcriptional regulator n=1 Tax=Pseudomonas TaxID=286 RepID=UPI00346786C2